MLHSRCIYFEMCHVNVRGTCSGDGFILGRMTIPYWRESELMLLKDAEVDLTYTKLKCKNDNPPSSLGFIFFSTSFDSRFYFVSKQ